METQGFVAGHLSVLCTLALVAGTASAAATTAIDRTSSPDAGPVHGHLSSGAIIHSLEQKEVDVTEVKAGLQKEDTTAVKTWLENYLRAHEGEIP
jgi:hypothetical protein